MGEYQRYQQHPEGGLVQVNDHKFFAVLAPSTNSIAIIMRHLGTNLSSRFTDFLTTDDEKEWRDREGGFDLSGLSRVDINEKFKQAW